MENQELEIENILEKIKFNLEELSNKEKAEKNKKYLKSPYDFYGIKVPEIRKIAKNYKNLGIEETYLIFESLWKSNFHEEKLTAIFLLMQKEKEFNRETWDFAISKAKDIKTWDICDALSSWIIGKMLAKDISLKPEIEKLAESKSPWEKRASIVSTIQLIKKGKIELTFKLAEKLVYDENIYVQKGAGWMIREAGKQQRISTREFILMHLDMKGNAFSYATEKMKELREMRKEFERLKK